MTAENESNERRLAKPGDPKLHNTGLQAGSIIDHALARLDKEQADALVSKAAEEALRLEVKRREQEQDHEHARGVVQDHVDVVRTLDKGGALTRHSVKTETTTGSGRIEITSKTGPTCFVATAAYGNEDHPDVVLLRQFRDEVLCKSVAGRWFIATYWRVGPVLAGIVSSAPAFRHVARLLLKPAVASVRKRLVRV